MSALVAVDAEALLHDYLVAQPEVSAIVGTRVSIDLPATPTYPLVLYHRAGGTYRDAEVLDRPMMQIEAWAAPTKIADSVRLIAAVRAVLRNDRLPGTYPRGIVTGSNEITGPQRLEDKATNAERMFFVVQLYTKPV